MTAGFPASAVEYCLEAAGLTPGDLDYVGFYDKPLLKFERLLETYLAYAPRGFRSFLAGHAGLAAAEAAPAARDGQGAAGEPYKGRCVFTEHHESHAASAFFPSPFDEAAILTLDGVGEWATASFGVGRGNRIAADARAAFPALAGPALLGVHLLLRLQGQLRRVQADGPGPLRRADLRRPDPARSWSTSRPTARSAWTCRTSTTARG